MNGKGDIWYQSLSLSNYTRDSDCVGDGSDQQVDFTLKSVYKHGEGFSWSWWFESPYWGVRPVLFLDSQIFQLSWCKLAVLLWWGEQLVFVLIDRRLCLFQIFIFKIFNHVVFLIVIVVFIFKLYISDVWQSVVIKINLHTKWIRRRFIKKLIGGRRNKSLVVVSVEILSVQILS